MYELEPQRRRFGAAPYLFGALTGVAIGLAVVAGIVYYRGLGGDPGARTAAGSRGGSHTTEYNNLIDASRRNAIVQATEMVAPAVVNVTVVRTETYRTRPFFWDDWFNRNWPVRKRKVGGYGSGLIIQQDGYIITNEHVVRGAEDTWVTLPDGTDMRATIVGSAPQYDLALLRVEAEDLPYAELGDSDGLMVGEWVIAIGSPFGHLLADPHPTVTVGVVSAFNRDVKAEVSAQQMKDLIQTDAAINPGNSGGPLVNSIGDVIGINAAIFSHSGGSEGIGFAIPANRAKWVVDEILKYGSVRQAYIGLTGRDITPAVAAAMDLEPARGGVLVDGIYDDGPAHKAGIRAGDLMISINGIEVRDIIHVNDVVYPARVDDELEIVIERKGKLKTVKLILEERPDDI
jgi:S1-C subfamily serine protease